MAMHFSSTARAFDSIKTRMDIWRETKDEDDPPYILPSWKMCHDYEVVKDRPRQVKIWAVSHSELFVTFDSEDEQKRVSQLPWYPRPEAIIQQTPMVRLKFDDARFLSLKVGYRMNGFDRMPRCRPWMVVRCVNREYAFRGIAASRYRITTGNFWRANGRHATNSTLDVAPEKLEELAETIEKEQNANPNR